MGLDISAYSQLKPVGKHGVEGAFWCEDDNHLLAYAYEEFPASFRGIEIVDRHEGRNFAFMSGGCFEHTPETEVFRFQAGSYSGYNMWRADLQVQFNPSLNPAAPFYELLWFADNEGTISTEACADLFADFYNNADKYRPREHQAVEYRNLYHDWSHAFNLGANNGLVDFH